MTRETGKAETARRQKWKAPSEPDRQGPDRRNVARLSNVAPRTIWPNYRDVPATNLSAAVPSLSGETNKKAFEDEAAFATVERSAATPAGYLAVHCFGSGLGSNDPINRTAIWAIKACRNFSHERMRHNGRNVSLL